MSEAPKTIREVNLVTDAIQGTLRLHSVFMGGLVTIAVVALGGMAALLWEIRGELDIITDRLSSIETSIDDIETDLTNLNENVDRIDLNVQRMRLNGLGDDGGELRVGPMILPTASMDTWALDELLKAAPEGLVETDRHNQDQFIQNLRMSGDLPLDSEIVEAAFAQHGPTRAAAALEDRFLLEEIQRTTLEAARAIGEIPDARIEVPPWWNPDPFAASPILQTDDGYFRMVVAPEGPVTFEQWVELVQQMLSDGSAQPINSRDLPGLRLSSTALNESLPGVMADYGEQLQTLISLRQEQAALLRSLGSEHPFVINLAERAEQIEGELGVMVSVPRADLCPTCVDDRYFYFPNVRE